MANHVYIMSSGQSVKIGRSVRPLKRISQVKVGNPATVDLAYTWEVTDSHEAVLMEREIHDLLRWARGNGEWFSLEVREAKSVGDLVAAGDHDAAQLLALAIRRYQDADRDLERVRVSTRPERRRLSAANQAARDRLVEDGRVAQERAYLTALALGLEWGEWDDALYGKKVAATA